MADPADEDPNKLDQAAAEPGAQDEQQTPGDQAGARPSEEGDPPQPAGDDSPADSDPLALAQQEPEPAAEPQPKPATTGKPPAEARPPTPQPTKQPAQPSDTPAAADPEAVDPTELDQALADLPEEDWRDGKLSHKSKSAFLSQRKVIQKQQAQLKQIEPLRKAKADLDQIEKLRQDAGLEPQEFIQGAILRSQLKRGDPRAIPVLEQTLAALKQRAGVQTPAAPQPPPPAAPPAPAFDPAQILADIEAAEANFDFDRLAALKTKLRDAAKPPAQQQPPQGAPPAQQPAAPPQPAPPAAAPGAQVDGELVAMSESLAALGVTDPVAHVRDLIQRFPELGNTPPGQRLRAVLAKHREVTGVPAPAPRQPAGQPLSGRGGPVRRGGVETPHDPLKHAIRR